MARKLDTKTDAGSAPPGMPEQHSQLQRPEYLGLHRAINVCQFLQKLFPHLGGNLGFACR